MTKAITTSNGTVTVPTGDTITLDNDFTFKTTSDSMYNGNYSDNGYTYTINDCDVSDINLNTIDWGLDSITLSPSTFTVGDTTINETDIIKLKAIIDIIEGLDDDAELKTLFNTQVALNKIKQNEE